MKVNYIELSDKNEIGAYDPLTKMIYLNSEIRHFPSFHDFVLQHELAHASIGNSFWENMKLELTNTPKLFKNPICYNEYLHFKRYINKKYGFIAPLKFRIYNKIEHLIMGFYNIFWVYYGGIKLIVIKHRLKNTWKWLFDVHSMEKK